jgi:hypothetical protein
MYLTDMMRVQGTKGALPIECVNPVKNKWRIRWDVQPSDGENSVTYMEEEFGHKPTAAEVKAVVMDWYNSVINAEILSGFKYEGSTVWLSQENQFNYKAAYDIAAQLGSLPSPVTFKFGDSDTPVYRTFETLPELADFYISAMSHIQKMLENGWKQKDGFDFNVYKLE